MSYSNIYIYYNGILQPNIYSNHLYYICIYISISILYLYLYYIYIYSYHTVFFTSHLSSPSIWQRADVGHQLHRLHRLPEPRVRELVEGVDVETDGALKDCGILAKDLV